LTHRDRARLRAAAYQAPRLYPEGAVGEILARELHAWEEFGFRFGGGALIEQLIEHLTTAPP